MSPADRPDRISIVSELLSVRPICTWTFSSLSLPHAHHRWGAPAHIDRGLRNDESELRRGRHPAVREQTADERRDPRSEWRRRCAPDGSSGPRSG